MTEDDQIDDLVDRWEAARNAGQDVSVDQLCQNAPHLQPAVQEYVDALKWIPSPVGHELDGAGSSFDPFHLQVGTILQDRYTLRRCVGSGGFATVWQAHDGRLDRDVALKVPRSRRAAPSTDVFVAEARRLAQLRHPAIVPVYDVVSEADGVFIVSAFIDGQTLADVIAEGKASLHHAVGLVAKVAEALHHAHQHGFVHRDVKPANIIIDNDGDPHLTDFGIAVSLDAQSTTPRLSGTLSYMAPEQARGDGGLVDARTDVFGLAVVLYELLAGQRPFDGKNPAAIQQAILESEPRSLRSHDKAVSQRLNDVCLQALSKAPAGRFDTAAEFAAVLGRCGTSRQPPRTALAVLLALAVTGGLYWLTTRPEPSTQGTAAIAGSPPTISPAALALPPVRSSVSTTVVDADLVLRGHRGLVSAVVASIDGRWLVSGSWDQTVRVWDADTGSAMGIYRGHTTGVADVAISFDSQLIVSGGGHNYKDSTVRIWNTETGNQVLKLDDHRHNVMAVTWAPDGEFFVSGSLDNTVCRWSRQTNYQVRPLGAYRHADVNNWARQVWTLAISPDSRTVAAGLRDGSIRLIDIGTGQQQASITTSTRSWINSVAFSPDGSEILSGSRDGVARRFSVTDAVLQGEYRPGLGSLNAVAWTKDGTGILCGGEASTFVLLNTADAATRATFRGHTQSIHCLAVTPAGRIVSGSRDTTIRLWRPFGSVGPPPGG